MQTYGYDALNRLTGSAEGTVWTRNYDYDRYGYDRYGNDWVPVNTNLPLSAMTPVAQSWFNNAANARGARSEGRGPRVKPENPRSSLLAPNPCYDGADDR